MTRQRPEDLRRVIHVILPHDFVDIVADQRGVEEEGDPLSGEEEAEGQEGVSDHFGEDELRRASVSGWMLDGR